MRLARAGVAVGVVAVVGVSIVVVLARGGREAAAPGSTPSSSGSGSPSPSPTPRSLFTFPPPEIEGLRVLRGGGGLVRSQEPAALIQTILSRFYDQTFLEPETWLGGIPTEAWAAFDESIRDQALEDAASLALGDAVPGLADLGVTRATLSIHVLLDADDKPEAAVADIVFDATGTLSDGGQVTVTNRAEFLLRPIADTWLIVGYPKATTKVTAIPKASPSASPTTVSPSGAPATGASP